MKSARTSRPRHARNVAAFFGEAPNWTLKLRDLYEGFDETDVDRLFLDLPEPGRALDVVARALRPGGVFVAYVPTALQLKDTVEALQYSGNFAEIESFETLMRHWHVKGMSVRPVHRMIAHSAFIIVARRLAAICGCGAPSSASPTAERLPRPNQRERGMTQFTEALDGVIRMNWMSQLEDPGTRPRGSSLIPIPSALRV